MEYLNISEIDNLETKDLVAALFQMFMTIRLNVSAIACVLFSQKGKQFL